MLLIMMIIGPRTVGKIIGFLLVLFSMITGYFSLTNLRKSLNFYIVLALDVVCLYLGLKLMEYL